MTYAPDLRSASVCAGPGATKLRERGSSAKLGIMQANTPLAIRPPVLVRMYVAGFLVFWIVVLVWTIILRPRASSITVAVLFLGFAVTLGYRLVSLAVTELPNGDLRVRNNFGSRVLSRTDVEAFSIHRGPTNTVQALLTDDTVYRIDVTLSPRFLGRNRAKRQLAVLELWLHDGS